MAIMGRYNFTTAHYSIASGNDGYGGRAETKTLVASALKFFRFKPDPLIAEAVVTRIGLKKGAVVYTLVTEDVRAAAISDNDLLQVSGTEQWRVYSTEGINGSDGTPHHWTLMVVPQDKII